MHVSVKLFGLTKTLADNQPELAVAVDGKARVKDLVAALGRLHPELSELILKKKVLVSVNQEIAHDDTELRPQDEVALLPPFAGGTNMDAKTAGDTMMARVQRENFSIDAELDRVRSRSTKIGGIAVFLGTARDRSKGRDVSGITFEHYEGMAQKKLREIRERALREYDVLEVLIVHRHGEIEIGENIVLIIAGAEHRADAFQACKWTIDELKQITPIWKREQTPEGEVWVEEHP